MSPAPPKPRGAAVAVLLLAILGVGAFLRLYGIGAKSLWLDEAQSLAYARAPFGEMLQAVRDTDSHPPLYYAALHVWMSGSQSAARARALSALVSVATLAVFYALARSLLPRAGALVAAALLAASAFDVYLAQEARNYALATCLVTLSWLLLVRLLRHEGNRPWPLWLGLAAANALAVTTFYYTLFAVAAQAAALAALWHQGGRRLLRRWAAWQLVPAAALALCVPVILDRIEARERLFPDAPQAGAGLAGMSATAGHFSAGFLDKLSRDPTGAVAVGTAALGLTALLAGLLGLQEPRLRVATAAALAWLLVPAAILAVFPFTSHAFEPKHLAFAAPALALLPGIALSVARRRSQAVALAVAAALLATNAVSLARYFAPTTEKEPWRAAVAGLARNVRRGDLVGFNPRQVKLPFAYYFSPARCPYPHPPVEPADVPLSPRLDDWLPTVERRRFWLVEADSNVAIPNRHLAACLPPGLIRHEDSHTYDGILGQIRVTLYDLRSWQAPPSRGPS